MDTIRKTSATAATAATAAAALALLAFSSAGMAQAVEPNYFYNSDNSMQVSYGQGTGNSAAFSPVIY